MNVFELFAKLNLDSSSYESGLKSAKSLAGTMGKGISTTLGVGTAAVTAATGATVAFAKNAVAAGMSFDSSMARVAATMGSKAEDMVEYNGKTMSSFDALRDFALEMGSTTMFTASQSADALQYMALAGYDAEKSMKMLPVVLNMAAAGGMDLARASDMVTDTASALGLEEKRTAQMVNEFAKAASTGNTSVEQLGDAFLTVGGLATNLNGGMVQLEDGTFAAVDGVQELEIALTAMANSGIKGSEAGTHMRNMLLKLSSPTDDGTKQLEALGVAVFDAEGNMRSLADIMGDLSVALDGVTQQKKIQAMTDLFNARDEASAEALLKAVGKDWNYIGQEILKANENGGAAEEMAERQLKTLSGAMQYFSSALEGAYISVSDVLAPALTDFVKTGTQGLSDITKAFKEGGLSGAMSVFGDWLADGLNQIIEKLPTFVDAGIQLLETLGQGLVDNFPTIVSAVMKVGKMLSDEFFDILSKIADNLSGFDFGVAAKKIVTFLVNAITNQGAELLSVGFTILTSLVNGMFEAFPEVINGAIQIIEKLAEGITQNLPALVAAGLDALMQFSYSLRYNAGILINSGLDLIVALVSGLMESLPTLIKTIPTIVTNIAGIINDNAPKLLFTGVKLIITIVSGIVKAIPTLIEEFPKIVKAIFSVITAVNWINLGNTIITGITNGAKALATELPQTLRNIGSKAVDWLKTINWHTLGADIIDLIKIGAASMKDAIPQLMRTIGRTIKDVFKSIDWKSLGKSLLEGLWAGMQGTTKWLTDKISEWCNDVWDSITGFFGIHSPSTLFAWAGENMALGLGMGFSDEMQRDVASEITDAVPTTFDVNAETKQAGTGGFVMPINIENFYNNTKDDIEALTNQIYYSLYDKILREKVVII